MSKSNGKTKEYIIEPLGARVLIRVEAKDTETPSGIIIPAYLSPVNQDSNAEKVAVPVAEVIAKGKECKSEVKIGDIISIEPRMAQPIYHPDNKTGLVKYAITHENNIDAILR